MSVVRWGCSMTTRSNWIGSPHDGSPRAPPRASPRSLRIASNTSGRREFVDRHSLGVGYRPKHGRLIADADNVGRPIAELGAGPPRLVTRALHRHRISSSAAFKMTDFHGHKMLQRYRRVKASCWPEE